MTDVHTTARPLADLVADFYGASGSYDPTELFARLLAEEPVHETVFGFYVVARYHDAVTVLKSNKAIRTAPPLAHQDSPEDILNRHFLSRKEPPDHERLRGLVQKTFSPRSVRIFTDQIREVVRNAVADARRSGRLDIATDIARPLPMSILCRIFGFPEEDRDRLSDALANLILAYRPAGSPPGAAELAERSAAHVTRRIQELIALRRRRPGDDLLSVMLQAQESGAEVSDAEILSIVGHLMQAGTQTTRILLSNGLLALLRHPAELARLRADPSLAGPAVEEILRWVTPARTLAQRVAVEDIHLGDRVIPQGRQLTVWAGAANRDPEVFTDPNVFDITRSPNPHLSFSTGVHFCLGTNLARLEGRVALSALLEELPEIELIESELDYGDSPVRPLLASMPVRCA